MYRKKELQIIDSMRPPPHTQVSSLHCWLSIVIIIIVIAIMSNPLTSGVQHVYLSPSSPLITIIIISISSPTFGLE